MAKKIMLINVTDDESRVAIVEGGVLQEMLIEHQSREQIKGNIYKGTAVQIQTGLQAAFVDFGTEKHGFLPKNEVNPHLYINRGSNQKNSIQSRLKVGQSVLVQVTREAVDHKGAALTTNITIPGRFMVLMPNSDKGGVSRKIEDPEERERLKSFLSGIQSEEHAVIIRTAGIGRSLAELKKDYTLLKRTWEEIQDAYNAAVVPGVIYEEDNVVIRTLRDYYSEDIAEIWVDNPETFQTALTFMKDVAPRHQKDLKLFVGERSLFATYRIEKQVEQLTTREVPLPSGGSIVIDQTEALVAIDVNSGKSNQEKNNDDTALRTNLEAAEEVLRQLRLRNMGGLIVVDFIDMETEAFRKKVEDRMHECQSKDKAKLSFGEISKFGLLELSRQRLSAGISRTVEIVCPTCSGKGRIPSLLASTNTILRTIREMAAKGNVARIESELPLELANHLLNERRQAITDLELEFGIMIALRGNPEINTFKESLLKPIYRERKTVALSTHTVTTIPEPQAEERDRNRSENSRRRGRRGGQGGRGRGRQENQSQTEETQELEAVESFNPSEVEEVRPDVEVESVVSESNSASSDLSDELVDIDPFIPFKESKKRVEHSESTEAKRRETNDADTDLPANVEIQEEMPEEETDEDIPEAAPVLKAEPKIFEHIVDTSGDGIHEGCLFNDVKVLEGEELTEIQTAFKNRLKGKIDNQPPAKIAEQYLWRTYMNGANIDSDSDSEVESATPSTEGEEISEAEAIDGSEDLQKSEEAADSQETETIEEQENIEAVPAEEERPIDEILEPTADSVDQEATNEVADENEGIPQNEDIVEENQENSAATDEESSEEESEEQEVRPNRRPPRRSRGGNRKSPTTATEEESDEDATSAKKAPRNRPPKKRAPAKRAQEIIIDDGADDDGVPKKKGNGRRRPAAKKRTPAKSGEAKEASTEKGGDGEE